MKKKSNIQRFSTLLDMRMQFLHRQGEEMPRVVDIQTQAQKYHKQIQLRRMLECPQVGRQSLLYIVSLLTSQIAVLNQRRLERC